MLVRLWSLLSTYKVLHSSAEEIGVINTCTRYGEASSIPTHTKYALRHSVFHAMQSGGSSQLRQCLPA